MLHSTGAGNRVDPRSRCTFLSYPKGWAKFSAQGCSDGREKTVPLHGLYFLSLILCSSLSTSCFCLTKKLFLPIRFSEYSSHSERNHCCQVDPNTGVSMYESDAIIKYLVEKYGNLLLLVRSCNNYRHLGTTEMFFFCVDDPL